MDSENLEIPSIKRIKLENSTDKFTYTVSRISVDNGNFNQSDSRIFDDETSRGNQCTANAVVFLAFTNNIQKWNSMDIDNVLIIGDWIYKLTKENNTACGIYLAAVDIVKNIHIPACGYLKDSCVINCEPVMEKQWSGLTSFIKCFNKFDSCVFTCNLLSFAFCKINDNCY